MKNLEQELRKVKFADFDGEQKLFAITKMYNLYVKNNWPNGATWESEEAIKEDLENDFNPEDYFTFYIDKIDGFEVVVKIGLF